MAKTLYVYIYIYIGYGHPSHIEDRYAGYNKSY